MNETDYMIIEFQVWCHDLDSVTWNISESGPMNYPIMYAHHVPPEGKEHTHGCMLVPLSKVQDYDHKRINYISDTSDGCNITLHVGRHPSVIPYLVHLDTNGVQLRGKHKVDDLIHFNGLELSYEALQMVLDDIYGSDHILFQNIQDELNYVQRCTELYNKARNKPELLKTKQDWELFRNGQTMSTLFASVHTQETQNMKSLLDFCTPRKD